MGIYTIHIYTNKRIQTLSLLLLCVNDSSLFCWYFSYVQYIATERSSLSSVINYHPSCGVDTNYKRREYNVFTKHFVFVYFDIMLYSPVTKWKKYSKIEFHRKKTGLFTNIIQKYTKIKLVKYIYILSCVLSVWSEV